MTHYTFRQAYSGARAQARNMVVRPSQAEVVAYAVSLAKGTATKPLSGRTRMGFSL